MFSSCSFTTLACIEGGRGEEVVGGETDEEGSGFVPVVCVFVTAFVPSDVIVFGPSLAL